MIEQYIVCIHVQYSVPVCGRVIHEGSPPCLLIPAEFWTLLCVYSALSRCTLTLSLLLTHGFLFLLSPRLVMSTNVPLNVLYKRVIRTTGAPHLPVAALTLEHTPVAVLTLEHTPSFKDYFPRSRLQKDLSPTLVNTSEQVSRKELGQK